MSEAEKLQQLARQVKQHFENSHCGHDYFHAERVAALALDIARHSAAPVDRFVLLSTALVHDLCRPFERETGKSHFGEEALSIIAAKLEDCSFSDQEIDKIASLVRYHDVFDLALIPELSLELKIHQDADRLEAIGAIGIARVFAFGAANGLPMYIPGESLVFSATFVDRPDHRTSSISHFYDKLLKLKDQMHTERGRELALERHALMEQYLEHFFREWGKAPSWDQALDVGVS